MRIKTRCRAQKCVNKLAGYGEMLNKTGTDGASGKYMLKKVSSEVLKLIEEFPASDFSEDTQETLDSLRALFSENVLQNLDEMQGLLDELRGEVERSKKVTASYRILFLPYKYSMWDSLESIHEAAMEDPECESLVMPIPYYDRDSHGNLAELHDESGLYPAELGILSWKDNTVEEIDPDIIYIHNPYDEGNRLTSIHPDYYTSRLTGDDRLVIYVPYYVSYTDDPDIFTSLGFAGIYADYVITQSDWYEKEYERLLDEYRMQSEANRRVIDYYDNGNKFSVLGNPKYDKVMSLTKDDYPISDDWHDALFCGSKRRLTILLDTTVELLIKQKEHVFRK
ncbi:hypothetical protein, partial [Ligilactobacillus sp.]|uniref:hypothetical protein n=1 Tax=Ligilactobacillus sp. TaxID=2767921 RepID=UPI002FDF7C75